MARRRGQRSLLFTRLLMSESARTSDVKGREAVGHADYPSVILSIEFKITENGCGGTGRQVGSLEVKSRRVSEGPSSEGTGTHSPRNLTTGTSLVNPRGTRVNYREIENDPGHQKVPMEV